MEEQLINFETAKLAKEKGFITHTVTTKFTNDYLLGGKNMMINETCILLWMCELQKWLREVHNIDINIECFTNKEGITIYDYIIYNENSPEIDWGDGPWLKYEDCLEVALNRALNDI